VYNISTYEEAMDEMVSKKRESNRSNHDELLRQLPEQMALAWGLGREPQRGPKRELSIRQIVETAIQIADQEGLAAVSMNRVASSLGYTAMSLYRYIPNKDTLLLLMQDAVCAIPIPPLTEVSDWREDMREYMKASARTFIQHPWFVDLPTINEPVTPNILKLLDWLLRSMRDLPLDEREKLLIVASLSGYARSWGNIFRDYMQMYMHNTTPALSPSHPDIRSALTHLVDEETYPFLAPLVRSGAYTSMFDESADGGQQEQGNYDEFGKEFEFGVERILDGIAHYIESKINKRG
jgi:AcrR family transcriptional regulator